MRLRFNLEGEAIWIFEASAVNQAMLEVVFDAWTNVEGWTELDQIEHALASSDAGDAR